ncbi:MAG: hypothetical protein IPK93_12585 [Solirubrobacterales bacterium]|nr:hypothetical protein [Solirubrobacterales bacterium]
MKTSAKTLVAVALLAGLTAFASGCGEDRSNLIPSGTAQQIEKNLTGIQALADDDKCFIALDATRKVQKQVEGLSSSVDAELKRSLLDGVIALQVLLKDPDKCTDNTTTNPTEPDAGITTTGDTGPTTPKETVPGNEKNPDKKTPENKPETPTPTPDPNPTPETPPSTDPPVDPGAGSGGVSPNQ